MLWSPAADTETEPPGPKKKLLGGGMIGACIGLLGGLLGIGGGVFVVPLLLYVLQTPTKIAAASSTFIVCFSSLTGFIGYAAMGDVNWRFILLAALASVAGGQAGSRIMSSRLKGKAVRILFSIVLFLMSAKLLYQVLS
jgi:hypothetical protein